MSLPAGADHPFFDAPITPRVLRGQWRPRRDAYAAAGLYEQVRIRIHRALTWLEASEARGASELDTQLIEQWVALNALYGRWDPQRREPVADGRALALFVDQLVASDEDGILAGFLHRQKDLVMQVFADRYVNRLFWDEPVDGQRIDHAVFDARSLLAQGKHALVVSRLLARIHFVRCQLVHGGSSYGGRHNRRAVKRCSVLLRQFTMVALHVMMEHGYADDWGALCYPPVE